MSSFTSIAEPEPALETEIRNEPRPVFQGLCSTCEHADHCTYPRNPEDPVMQCTEFDDLAKQRLATVWTPDATRRISPPEATEEPSVWQGLCRTCQGRDVCTFLRTHAGVWQCEEYR